MNTRRRKGLGWFLLFAAVVFTVASVVAYAAQWRHRFYHHVTHEESSHQVNHSSFQATVRDGKALEFQLYQQDKATKQPLVLFTSGDGGWSPFCADIAAHIAATGVTVVGVDVKSYLVNFATPQKPISPEQITHDYDTIVQLASAQPGVDAKAPLVLAGWSLGAGFSVLVASQPEFNHAVNRVVAISLPMYGELAWKPADAIIYFTHGTPHEKVFDVHQYLKKLDHTPIVFLNATNDDSAPLREAKSLYETATGSKHLFAVEARGHHFEGGEQEFYRDLDLGLSSPQIADKSDKKLKET